MNPIEWLNALKVPDWGTWIAHTLVCLAVCFPFGVIRTFGGPGWFVPIVATAMLAFYVGREIGQIKRSAPRGCPKPLTWDNLGDITGPLLVCLAAWLI
jgi:hypothetical protein